MQGNRVPNYKLICPSLHPLCHSVSFCTTVNHFTTLHLIFLFLPHFSLLWVSVTIFTFFLFKEKAVMHSGAMRCNMRSIYNAIIMHDITVVSYDTIMLNCEAFYEAVTGSLKCKQKCQICQSKRKK